MTAELDRLRQRGIRFLALLGWASCGAIMMLMLTGAVAPRPDAAFVTIAASVTASVAATRRHVETLQSATRTFVAHLRAA